MIVTLTPNPSLDRSLFLDTFTRGAVNRCSATLTEPSGKGINVALALRAISQRTPTRHHPQIGLPRHCGGARQQSNARARCCLE